MKKKGRDVYPSSSTCYGEAMKIMAGEAAIHESEDSGSEGIHSSSSESRSAIDGTVSEVFSRRIHD
jgi:hypothetical protein